jgi:hypothetical protein
MNGALAPCPLLRAGSGLPGTCSPKALLLKAVFLQNGLPCRLHHELDKALSFSRIRMGGNAVGAAHIEFLRNAEDGQLRHGFLRADRIGAWALRGKNHGNARYGEELVKVRHGMETDALKIKTRWYASVAELKICRLCHV